MQNYNGVSYDWTCPRLITKIKCTSAGEWDKYVNVTQAQFIHLEEMLKASEKLVDGIRWE